MMASIPTTIPSTRSSTCVTRLIPMIPIPPPRPSSIISAFFVAYAADLKIGRVAPQKVDPRLFRSRKTIDVLRVLTELNKQRDPGTFLSSFEPRNEHYQALKRMMRDLFAPRPTRAAGR